MDNAQYVAVKEKDIHDDLDVFNREVVAEFNGTHQGVKDKLKCHKKYIFIILTLRKYN